VPAGARKTVDEKLAALNALSAVAERAVQNEAIQAGLEDKHFRVVAKAAAISGERSLHERTADLVAAYTRFLQDPIKRDPNCLAKAAIARALVQLNCQQITFFMEGIRYRQLEPVWGGTTDTAVDVRCSCAMGLVATGYWRAIQELTALLSDSEAPARSGAVRAISCGNPREAEALLRFKVLTGDKEPEVIGECFTALLSIAADDCLEFVAQFLSGKDDTLRDLAALALGESRHPEALRHLRAAWDEVYVPPAQRAVLLRAGALHRTEPAFDWLIDIIERGSRTHADIAVDALSVYERNTKLIERVQSALGKRQD
jgi:HEAT repeat protein